MVEKPIYRIIWLDNGEKVGAINYLVAQDEHSIIIASEKEGSEYIGLRELIKTDIIEMVEAKDW